MHTMENPATASWGLSISDADFARLKRGVMPRDMDDKWIFKAMTDEELADEATTNGATTDEATTDEATDEATTDKELTDEELMDELLMDEEATDEALTDEATLDLDQGGNISIRRSWTNKELYRLAVKPSEGGTSAKIEAITWEQNQGDRISEEQARIDAVILCRQILECDFAAAPDYDPLLSSAFPRSAAVDSMTV
jgi:tetrahydromethanopterin S-methyltransferase subunit H